MKVATGEVFEKVGGLMGEAWNARVVDEVILGDCLIAMVRVNGRRSTNAMVRGAGVAVENELMLIMGRNVECRRSSR